MFILRVTYLMGRVYSAVFDDGDTKLDPEWPPHPSRLFSAFVAAWGDGGAEEALRPALEWLEMQEAPTIYAGICTPRKLVQAFVPVNDDRSLPQDRPRKPRTFPSASLSHPDVYFVWNASIPAEVLPSLDIILRRTSSLGHSSSLVAVETADAVPDRHWKVWKPHVTGGTRMRVAYPGRLRELMEKYEYFKKDQNKIHRPSVGKTALYAEPQKTSQSDAQGMFDRMIVLRRDEGPRGSLRSTLSVTAALRGAILKFAPQPPPEYLSGHAPESTPERPVRSARPHIALAPLAFIGMPHASGDLLGIAVLLPKALAPEELAVCWKVASAIEELAMPWGKWKVVITDAEERRKTLRSQMWCRRHFLWSTVTPFVFDRYPKDPYGPEAQQIVRQAFVRLGLPEPSEIDLRYDPWHIGVPKASLFPAAPARLGKPQRYHCHVRARFDEPITGPVIAGAGRFYGYGLFAPLLHTGGME
jgi:CRISPR-associated protein Csb2